LILEQSPRFEEELETIVDFIALDSPDRALDFYYELLSKIHNIPTHPYSHRQRITVKDKNVRELIFKGYTIPFKIDEENNKIVILGIFNQNLWD
jgi:toxin ParE1/3/4